MPRSHLKLERAHTRPSVAAAIRFRSVRCEKRSMSTRFGLIVIVFFGLLVVILLFE